MLDPRVEDEPVPEDEDPKAALTKRPSERLRRDAQLLGRSNSECRKWLRKKIDAICTGFEKQSQRADKLEEWWRMYHCELSAAEQRYNGTAQVYIPAIHDAVEARATRFANQLFPQSGRYVDCTSSDGEQPYEILALVDHHIRGTDSECPFKTNVVKPLFRNGDIEGHYNLYIDWQEVERLVVSRETKTPEGAAEEIVDIAEEEISIGFPGFEVLHDCDVLVLPASSDTVLAALQRGGSATIVRRWSKDKAEEMVDCGECEADIDDENLVSSNAVNASGIVDLAKALARAVGVRLGDNHMTAFETWLMVPLNQRGAFAKDGKKRLCRLWWGLDREPLGLKRNPYWNDRCPLLSHPREKVPGVFKGKSAIDYLSPVQYEINDAANEKADVDHMAAMPAIRQDPASQTNVPLIIAPGAVWKAPAGAIEFMQFPDLSARGRTRVVDGMEIINRSASVNPSMIAQSSGGQRKRNQAEIAMEQQVDLLTTAEAVSVLSEGILDQAVSWIVDLDHQFRDREMTVRAYGKEGVQANMTSIAPIQNGRGYRILWVGAEQMRLTMAMMQQGTALINVLRGMRQDIEAEGLQLRLSPLLERLAANQFGPTLAALTLVDRRHMLGQPPDAENDQLAEGFMVPVSPMDNPQEHLPSHMQAMQMTGDPHGTFKIHIQLHLQKQAEQQAQMGNPGVPGGAGPGVAGTPPPGAAPPPRRRAPAHRNPAPSPPVPA